MNARFLGQPDRLRGAQLNNPETIEWKAFIFDLESGQKERDIIFFQRVAFDNLN